MREVRWRRWAALAAVLQACAGEPAADPGSDGVELGAAALAAAFDPLRCTLRRECERWGELISEPPGEPVACAIPEGELQPLAWHVLTGGGQAPCSFGHCRVMDLQLASEPDGGVVTLSRLELPATLPRQREVGLQLARWAADGTPRGVTSWDYGVPPPGVEVQRHAQLLNAANGDPLLASSRAFLPGDAPRPLTVAEIAGRKRPLPKPPAVSTQPMHSERTAIGPGGELLVASTHVFRDQPIPNEEQDWNAIFVPQYRQRASLTLLDRRGRVSWNRPWLADEQASSAIQALHVGADGQSTVRVAADRGALAGIAIVRLDRAGRVLWRRVVAEGSFEVQSAVDSQGNVYVLAVRWWDELEARLERLDANGRRSGLWSLSEVGFVFELHAGHERVWLTSRVDMGSGSELWATPFAPGSASCEAQRYGFSGDWLDLFEGNLALVEGPNAQVYFANPRMVAKLGGMP